MNTSERLGAWINDLGLYDRFWEYVVQRLGQSAAYLGFPRHRCDELYIEFLKEHFYEATPEGRGVRAAREDCLSVRRELEKRAEEIEQEIIDAGLEVKCTLPRKVQVDPWGAPTDTRGYPDTQ